MDYPQSIENLIKHFSRLPSVGPKTAERYVFYLLKQHPEILQSFAQAIAELKEKTLNCQICHALSNHSPCSVCGNNNRDKTKLCIVADTKDMASIENTEIFKGYYHILGGLLNTVENIGPKNLNMETLMVKIKTGTIKEIILALAPNLEGETTSLYIKKITQPFNIVITRLARGLPTGSDLEYTDKTTLTNAIKFRNKL